MNSTDQATLLTPEDTDRADTYRLLAALLAGSPSALLLQTLASLAVDTASEPQSTMLTAWAGLKLAAQHTEVTQLAEEYQALFIGLGRGEIVPYASWYLTGMLMDKPLAILREDMRRLGFIREADIREPEDHVATLCELMSLLIVNPTTYSYATQKGFFQQHLSPWLEKFFMDLQQAETAHFYRSVGYVGQAFINIETQAFTMT